MMPFTCLQEFHPYVFQIFSQLIELRPSPLPGMYMALFQPLLTPVLWERPGNIPALVRLVRAYLAKAVQQIIQQSLLVVRREATQELCAHGLRDAGICMGVSGSWLPTWFSVLQNVLGIFQKLVAGRAHDHEGMRLLESVANCVPSEELNKFLPEVGSS